MSFGTVPVATESGTGYEYNRHFNPLLAQNLIRITVAPFGRPVVNFDVDNSEYATVEAAAAFARVLHAEIVDGATLEAATFTTSYPKYTLLLGALRVNAGAIASIIGNDPAYGDTPQAKAGHLAELLNEPYEAATHNKLMADLIESAKWVTR